MWQILAILNTLFLGVVITLTYITITFSAPIIPTPKPPNFDEDDANTSTSKAFKNNSSYTLQNYPELYERLDSIIGLFLHKFVYSWFQNINDNKDSDFLNQTHHMLNQCIDNVTIQLENKMDNDGELISNILSKTLTLAQQHFATYTSVKDTFDDNTVDKELKLAMVFNKHFKLHKAIVLTNSKIDFDRHLQDYLRTTIDSLVLPCILPADEIDAKVSTVLIRELLVCNVFKNLIDKLSSPLFWNTTIINISNKMMKEQEQVQSLRKFLSANVSSESSRDYGTQPNTDSNDLLYNFSTISKYSNNDAEIIEYGYALLQHVTLVSTGKEFELILKNMYRIDNALMLNYLRNLLVLKLININNNSEIKKKHNKKSILLYRKRLELLLNLTGERMNNTNESDSHRNSKILIRHFENEIAGINVLQILSNPKYSIVFENYIAMARPTLLVLMNFWKAVEEIKDPLEDSKVQLDILYDHLDETNNNDVKNVCALYLLDIKPWFENNPDYELLCNSFGEEKKSFTYYATRQALLLLQEDSTRILKTEVFEEFLSSKHLCFLFTQMDSPSLSQNTSSEPKGQDATVTDEASTSSLKESTKSESRENGHSTVDIITNTDILQALDDILRDNHTKAKKPDFLFGNRAEGLFKQESLFQDDDLGTLTAKDSVNLTSNSKERNSEETDDVFGEPSATGGLGINEDNDNSIESLTLNINSLENQLNVLRHLILKSELTNNQKELHLLKKSERTILRELQQKKNLKKELSSNDLFLFNNTNIYISDYVIKEDISFYNVQVTYMAHTNEMQNWRELKRFSEFVKLNEYMRKQYESVRSLKFPAKLEMAFNRITMLEERKTKLDKYLNQLLSIPQVCLDKRFIEFLTTSSYKTSSNGGFENSSISSYSTENDQSSAMDNSEAASASYLSSSAGSGSNKQTSFVKPISDLFASIFQLEKGTSIRGMAIIVVLQQLLGGTVERYIKELIKRTTSKERLCDLLAGIDETMKEHVVVPDKDLAEETNKPSKNSMPKKSQTQAKRDLSQSESGKSISEVELEDELKRLKEQSLVRLEKLMISQCSKAVGVKRSKRGASLVHGLVQNKYLNYSLLLYVLDIVLQETFM